MRETTRLFEVGFRAQTNWGCYAVAAFFLGGIGAGLFVSSLFLGLVLGLIAGLVIVAVGKNLAHLLELGQPLKFLLSLSRPGSSWISRGVIFDLAFIVFGALYTAPFVINLWASDSGLGVALQALALLSSLALMIYTGFLLASSSAIPFWNTTLLPLLFVLYALLGGVSLILIALPFSGQEAVDAKTIQTVTLSLVTASLVFVLVYVLTMFYSTIAAKQAVHALMRGKLSLQFVGGVLIVGLVVPLLIAAFASLTAIGAAATAVLAVGGLLALIGALLFFYSILKAGYYPPAI